MEKRKLGKNRGVWYGKVVSELTFSHDVKDRKTGEVVESFYSFQIQTEIIDRKGNTIDASIVPVTVPTSKLQEIKPEVEAITEKISVGDLVFLKGSWRAYDYKDSQSSRTRLEQNAYVKIIEVHDDFQVRTRNKFEFEGVLVKKLYEFERKEDGAPVKDEKGRLVPKTDEEGNIKYVVRKNKEGKVVNDFIVAINRPNGSDYIPCIAYTRLATKIAKEIPVGAEVEGAGYIRAREYQSGGVTRLAYEAVVTSLEVKETTEEEGDE